MCSDNRDNRDKTRVAPTWSAHALAARSRVTRLAAADVSRGATAACDTRGERTSKRVGKARTVAATASSRQLAREMGVSPRTVRRDSEPTTEFVVGRDGKVYRSRTVMRAPEFVYQRKAFARDMFAAGWSKRRIAEACGVSAMTIVRDLVGMTSTRVVGTDGKSYPGKRPVPRTTIVVDAEGVATIRRA